MAECVLDSEKSSLSRSTERRRALFPTENDDDSDLGHMSPLHSEPSYSPPDSPLNFVSSGGETNKCNLFDFDKNSIKNYIILGTVDNTKKTSIETVEESADSLIFETPLNSQVLASTPDASLKLSPTKKHKTPQDSVITSSKIPKLIHKSVDSELIQIGNNKKRKYLFSDSSPSSNKHFKEDSLTLSKTSKVRTSLFTNNELEHCLSPKSFYSKMEKNDEKERNNVALSIKSKISKPRSSQMYLCNRRKRNNFGQINNGVRHKIRKPKLKKTSKNQILKAALNIIENSPLNEYLQEMANIQQSPKIATPRLIQPIKNEQKITSTSNMQISNDVNRENRKRESSPVLYHNRKFFKSSRSKAVVVIDNRMKLTYEEGKLTIPNKPVTKKVTTTNVNFDLSDLISCENEELLSPQNFNTILEVLDENKENKEKCNEIVKSVPTNSEKPTLLNTESSSNNIEIQQQHESENIDKSTTNTDSKFSLSETKSFDEDLFLSPTSQMCDMTSGLALNSPKKAIKNFTTTLNELESMSNRSYYNCRPARFIMEEKEKKLFPIFYGKTSVDNQKNKMTQNRNCNKSGWTKLPHDQMLLDAGQKRFGVTECPECKLIFHMGDPSEEILHLNYHNSANVFKFNGWKNERVVENLTDARIIRVIPGDSKLWWKKVKDLLQVVNKEFGISENCLNFENSQVFLYINNRTIQGCLVAAPKYKAHKMLDEAQVDTCSEESFIIKCGVSLIWVSKNYRRKGVGSALMNSLKKHFVPNCVLTNQDIGLSGPTVEGKIFATKYFNTKNFLVYIE